MPNETLRRNGEEAWPIGVQRAELTEGSSETPDNLTVLTVVPVFPVEEWDLSSVIVAEHNLDILLVRPGSFALSFSLG